jgi:hypothetical protein
VVARQARLPWERQDWRGLEPTEQDERLKLYVDEDRRRGFNLSKPPLMRCALIRLAEDAYAFVWSFHHLLLDGWSISLLQKELFAFYDAFRQGRDLPLERPQPYRDYITWLRRQDIAEAETFWRGWLKGFSVPTPLDRARTQNGEAAGGEYFEHSLQVPEQVAGALAELARRHQLTTNTVVQGIWALMLSYYSGERDIVFGTTVSGRQAPLPGIESMVGLFFNALPVRVKLPANEPLLSWLKTFQQRQVELRQYEHTSLMQIQMWSEVPRGQPLFRSIFGFENYPTEAFSSRLGGGAQISNFRVIEKTNYSLSVMAWHGADLRLKFFYDSLCFDAPAIARMGDHFQALLDAVIKRPEAELHELQATLAESDERRRRVTEEQIEKISLEKLAGIKRRANLRASAKVRD